MVIVVLGILNVCSGASCCVCGCYNKSIWLFFMIVFCVATGCIVWVLWPIVMFLALFCYHLCTWFVPSRIFEQAECLWCTQWLTIAQSQGSTRLGASLPEDVSRDGFWIIIFFKFHTIDKAPKKELCQWENHVLNNKMWLVRLPFHSLTKLSMLLMHIV
jgi:hypothetical protein